MEHKDYVTIKPGTAVTRKILDNLGSPDDGLKIIHVAGTNGKGSTAEFFTQILIAAGKKVGTFTSPAVYDFYDQFRIDGKPLPEDVAEKYFGQASKAAEGLGATDFEIQTAGIILAFYKEGCEWAVIECGMGGLNDATNAINKKQLVVITSISLEHTQYLGNTIEEICAQKAGIIKNCPAVINDFQPSDAARKYLKNTGGIFAGRVTYAYGENLKEFQKVFWYCDREYELSDSGTLPQVCDAATAIEGAKILGIPERAIREGIKNARLKGRVEKFCAFGREYILDGAHNPEAFAPLCAYLSGVPREKVTVIFGCLNDKDVDGNLSALAPVAANVIAVECDSPRKVPLDQIDSACKKYFKNVTAAQSVTHALNSAFTQTVVVCGSFTLLKEAKQWIDKRQ
ncbi:MAG: hypothetical protein K2O44_04420 [Clostridia bacterium]|nr:hypothetical protein [Clostridia bacterium]